MESHDGEPALTNVLVPSSQGHEPSSEPPRKRRRITSVIPDLDDDETTGSQASEASLSLPTNELDDFIEIDDDILGNHRSRYEAVLHEPEFVESQKNLFVSQVEQPWSSPTRIRGPRWRKRTPTPSPSPQVTPVIPQTNAIDNANESVLFADDFDDEEIRALMEGECNYDSAATSQPADTQISATQRQQTKNMRQTTLFGMHTTQRNPQARSAASQSRNWKLVEKNEPPTHHQISEEAMQKWIFPLNVGTIRDYQYNIVHKALFNNILVALPTGLGKTFIAATVMMNWYNWTKNAQIVFMAPTKPLVAQQIEACFHIAGIPRSQTTLMTGEIPSVVRADEWQARRVFFMTPQTMINDLKSGIADPKKIVLVVVDEAHKATGNYAYVEVVRFLRRFNPSFRVLALTATPGASVEAVQKVMDGLDIARVEIRTEDSLDIQSFVHHRNTELQYFNFSDEIQMCLELFSKAVQPVMDKLCSQNAYWGKDPTMISLYGLMQARKQWMSSEAGRKASHGVKGMINSCFTPLLSLAHNLELLKNHGIGPFFHKMKIFESEHSNSGKYSKMIIESPSFVTLMGRLRTWIQNDDFVGHPKLEYLNSVVLNHFMDAGNGLGRADGRPPSDTRIMIFAHYRDSAEEICRVLNRHQPMIRAHVFVGQSHTKGSDGMDQKKQTEIIQKFKGGTYNTLVATSIGEEGLDIGEVDLIVCYDCSKSPIRMLQRMGRTGRKRAGNIVMLLMRGKEEADYWKAKDAYQKMQELIESGRDFTFHEDQSPRIVPKTIIPVVSKEHVEIPIENTQPGSVEPSRTRRKGKKKPPKKFHMPDGVETGFKFLGSKGGEQSVVSKKIKKRKRLDDDEAVLQEDIEILLTPEQEVVLDERYASVVGEEEQFIQRVELNNQPAKLRKIDKVKLVSHSKSTKRIVQAVSLAHNSERYEHIPTESPEEDVESNSNNSIGTGMPFYQSQQEALTDQTQPEGLPELDDLFRKQSCSRDGLTNQSKRRSKKQVISDDDDED